MTNPIVILHNGSAQRGHTVDYNPNFCHIYHHFGCGAGDNVPTFFANTFWVHPMEFVREYCELSKNGIFPISYCDPAAKVITPFDMLIDHATEAWIAYERGEREYASCGFGTWCAIESRTNNNFTIYDYSKAVLLNEDYLRYMLEETWKECCAVLASRKVDINCLPEYKDYFVPNSWKKKNLISHFIDDIKFFLKKVEFKTFDQIYNGFDSLIFEGAQGLGLDIDCGKEWHTTSHTGLTNPINLLNKYKDFTAEVCYVSRSYLTRHGIGYLEEETKKKEINPTMIDLTNVPNEFQGTLRYGYLEDLAQKERIKKDWSIVEKDSRYTKSMAITHCNEFEDLKKDTKYFSCNKFTVIDRSL